VRKRVLTLFLYQIPLLPVTIKKHQIGNNRSHVFGPTLYDRDFGSIPVSDISPDITETSKVGLIRGYVTTRLLWPYE
jgi:hypothetical protein